MSVWEHVEVRSIKEKLVLLYSVVIFWNNDKPQRTKSFYLRTQAFYIRGQLDHAKASDLGRSNQQTGQLWELVFIYFPIFRYRLGLILPGSKWIYINKATGDINKRMNRIWREIHQVGQLVMNASRWYSLSHPFRAK